MDSIYKLQRQSRSNTPVNCQKDKQNVEILLLVLVLFRLSFDEFWKSILIVIYIRKSDGSSNHGIVCV